MKILITGGHLTPALAVIEQLGKNRVYYAGRKYSFEGEEALSFEYREIERLKIPFLELKTGRLQRKFTRFTLVSLLKLPPGFLRAYRILKKVKPDVVLCFGSYVSVPVGIVAKLMNIPLVIHEQTLEVGFANRILSNFADKVCISFESSRKYFPKEKCVLTGNPLRKTIKDKTNLVAQNNRIYVSGGSTGSHVINKLVEQTLTRLLSKFTIVHQTGDSRKFRDFDRLLKIKNGLDKKLAERYQPVKFLSPDESSSEMAKASFFVGRSGINTVCELIYLNKPALLVPLAVSQRNEQLKNAEYLKNLGLSEVCREEGLTAQKFAESIILLSENLTKYKLNKNVLINDAALNVIKVLNDVHAQKNP